MFLEYTNSIYFYHPFYAKFKSEIAHDMIFSSMYIIEEFENDVICWR